MDPVNSKLVAQFSVAVFTWLLVALFSVAHFTIYRQLLPQAERKSLTKYVCSTLFCDTLYISCNTYIFCLMLQDCICTTLAVKCSQNVWVTRVYSFRVATATSTTAFTQQPSARFHRGAHYVSSTTKTSPSCCLSLSHTATRLCLSWRRCARYGWVLWRAGVLSITGRMSRARRAGLKSTSTDHCIGSTKYWQRWVLRTIKSLLCHRHPWLHAILHALQQ